MSGGTQGKNYRAIAIDGPAASGKSTVARLLAERLGVAMVNTGAMYRAVAWEAIRRGIDPQNSKSVVGMLNELHIVCGISERQSTITINGESDPEALRSKEVNAAVSCVSAVPEVRSLLVEKQRELLQVGDLVMEGRDIGSVVFPGTPHKFYIDASEEIRMKRRSAEGLADAVGERDRKDSQRKNSPLKVAEGATKIDSSELSIEEVLDLVMGHLREQGWFQEESFS